MDPSSPQPVLFVLNTLARGGMEQMLLALARTMQRRGRYRPIIACLAGPGELADEALAAGLDLHCGLLHHKFDLKVLRRLRRILAGDIAAPARGGEPVLQPAAGDPQSAILPRRQPVAAVVVVNVGGDRMFWTSLARGRRRDGSPALVLWCHSTPQPGRRLVERLNRLLVGRLDAVAVLGGAQAQAYASIEHLPAARCHVVANGLEAERLARLADRSGRDPVRSELGAADDDVVVMCVANARPIKRVDLFCQAAAKLAAKAPAGAPAVRFWLVGDEPRRGRIDQLLGELNLRPPDFVRLGPRADLDRLWPAADIGVCCSDSEGLSVSMLEGMAAGVAFVSTTVGEHAVVIEHERTGLLIPPGSADALAEALARLAADPPLRARLGSAAASAVRDRYTAERMADAFEEMLQAAMTAAPSNRR